jgi:hypothetical protein
MLKLSEEFDQLLNQLSISFETVSKPIDDGSGVESVSTHLEVDEKYAVVILKSVANYVDTYSINCMLMNTLHLF